ncbi:cytochrome c [Rhodobacteraceae bacterium R_SAG10]|nr:cytochrome c [Rhodobacteraceae bacterium R_SAG10]
MTRHVALGWSVLGAVCAFATNAQEASVESIAAGEAIYAEHCAVCHQPGGGGDGRLSGAGREQAAGRSLANRHQYPSRQGSHASFSGSWRGRNCRSSWLHPKRMGE